MNEKFDKFTRETFDFERLCARVLEIVQGCLSEGEAYNHQHFIRFKLLKPFILNYISYSVCYLSGHSYRLQNYCSSIVFLI